MWRTIKYRPIKYRPAGRSRPSPRNPDQPPSAAAWYRPPDPPCRDPPDHHRQPRPPSPGGPGAPPNCHVLRRPAPNCGGGGEQVVLCAVGWLPVAHAAEGSATLDGAGLFLPLSGRRHVGADQPASADEGALGGWARSQSVRWRVIDSQSVKTTEAAGRAATTPARRSTAASGTSSPTPSASWWQ